MDPGKRIQFPHPAPSSYDNFGDTTLSLKCFGNGGSNSVRIGMTQSSSADNSGCPDDGCRLVLGLGPTPSAYCCSVGVGKTKSLASAFSQGHSSGNESILKLGLSADASETLGGPDCSLSAGTETTHFFNQVAPDNRSIMFPVVDEGSTSAKKSGGFMPSLLFTSRRDSGKASLQNKEYVNFVADTPDQSEPSLEPSSQTDISVSSGYERADSTISSQQKSGNLKKCKFAGCTKGARGASGFCIGHGGGQRCQKLGCNKGAESRTTFCKAHGGGRRCQHLGCTKSAEGKTDFCIAHGGGRRCGFPGGCTKAARGKSGLCIKHGGGKRCKVERCTRSAEGQAGLCISHGGGRRCQYLECTKGAQGSTMFCKAHGGGKRCIFAGCTKGAEGSTPLCKAHGGGKRCMFDGGGICPKSVHGGTNFCVAHGGGKRCVEPGCTKSARGRTDRCVKHGGGKRCKYEGCAKSAQGSTDFCKAHGGGKRCTWGEGKCEKFARGKSGLCAAHNSMSQNREINKRGLIGPGLFHGLVSAASTSSMENHSSSGVSAASDCIDSSERPEKREKLIPLQVLVPPSMKSSSSSLSFSSFQRPEGRARRFDIMDPEERVHGGGLMSLLSGSLKNPIDGI